MKTRTGTLSVALAAAGTLAIAGCSGQQANSAAGELACVAIAAEPADRRGHDHDDGRARARLERPRHLGEPGEGLRHPVGQRGRGAEVRFRPLGLVGSGPERFAASRALRDDGARAGRHLKLVGHADPRGEQEYNLTLGAHRASSAAMYLEQLGVNPSNVTETSRGKLDAMGTDETGWRKDRRVDLDLE